MLSVNVTKKQGDFTLEAAFESSSPVTGLYGPSGSGKSTIVNLIAGLSKPDRGVIKIGDRVFDDTSARIHVPAYKRRIGYVFQDARLFPHRSVEQNLDYGRRMNDLKFDAAHFSRVIDLLGIEPLLKRRPGQLSGGERQRVAIGRALLLKPLLLLLDEPIGALDQDRRAEILPYLERLRDEENIPMIYVSHDPDETRRLAGHVVMMRAGRVAAEGGPDILPP